MKSYQFKYENSADLLENLQCIREECTGIREENIMFYLSWTESAKAELQTVTEKITEVLPNSIYYGNEASGNILHGDLAYGIAISCYAFESEDARLKLLWVEEGTEMGSLDDLWAVCKNEKGLRSVELIPSIGYLDVLKIDNSIPDMPEDVLIHGGASVNYDNPTFEASIIAKGHGITRNGMAVVLYYGKDVHFEETYILGWKGLGRHMKVTKSQGKQIFEIDDQPAFSIYEKYLNMTAEDSDNLVFPLIVEEDGVEYIRTPQMFLPDKSMRMFANIEEGLYARIAYGDKNTILASLYAKAAEIQKFAPQAIKAYSCAARRLFWGDDDVYKETRPLQKIAPIGGFYTGGEILRFKNKLRVLNSTLVLISCREGEAEKSEPIVYSEQSTIDKSLISRLTYFAEKIVQEQEEARQQLAEKSEELGLALNMADEANRAKTQFLFNMSHDIRTPMNAILGFTNMAMKHIEDEVKVKDCLKKTIESGNLLLSLINSVLDMSRIESGSVIVNDLCGDVMLSFASIEGTMQELAETKNINLTFGFGEIKDRYVYCDFNRCLRIFVNIISNAIKYTKENGRVEVFCEQIGRKNGFGIFRYTFRDNGIGMSEEFQKHVFEQFSRAKSVTQSGIQGTGLGMAVSKALTELLNGEISVQSKLGEGTTFTVTLPFKIQEEQKYTDLWTGDVISAEETAKPHKPVILKGKRVLLVEDNELNREIASDILQDENLVVEEAENGQVAVDLLQKKGPKYYDYILMDIQMPVMNGFEATQAIRSMYSTVHIPIIALSANAFQEDVEASLAAGMDAHVAKPININELFQVMEQVYQGE